MMALILRSSRVTVPNHPPCKFACLRAILFNAALVVCVATVMAAPAAANVIELGDAVITGFSGVKAAEEVPANGDLFDEDFINLDGASMQIRRLEPEAPPIGQLIDAPNSFSVKARDIGQVFAIGLDDGDDFDLLKSTPNIYLGATSAFGIQIVRPDSDGDGRPERIKKGHPDAEWMPGQFGPNGGPGSIWKVDGKSGNVSLFATIPDNSGPGLGDIVFDRATRQFFVSDLDSGLIHRLSADGAVIDSFDHGETGRPAAGLSAIADDGEVMNIKSASFDALKSKTWGLAPAERMVWGLAIMGGRLYYTVASGPDVWSVGINLDGTFASDARREIEVLGTPGNFPVSDIAFDNKGYMYIAQRGGVRGSFNYSDFTEPNKSVVFRFRREIPDDPETPGIWTPIPEEYAVGFPPDFRNTSGGLALGYGYDRDDSNTLKRGACDRMVWSTGDALRDDPDLVAQLAVGGAPIVHGLQGNDRTLVRPENEPPTAAYFVDYDGEFGDRRTAGHVGDVEIWQPCDKAADYGSYTPIPDPPPVEVTPEGDFNLRVEKNAIGPCVLGGLGFLCDYVVRVTNTGSDPYVGPIVVKDQLPSAPAGAVMTFAPQPPWLCLEILPSEHQCTYDTAVLWPGDSVDLFVNVDLPAAYPLCHLNNAAGLVWPLGFGDANPADDFDVASALIPAAHCPPPTGEKTNLKIEKFAWTPFCQENATDFICQYLIIVRNTGPGVYSDTIEVAETVPDGTTATFSLQPPWNCGGVGPDYTCEHEPVELNPGEGVALGATVKVPKALAAGLNCKATNKASIVKAAGGTSKNTDPADDEAEATALLPTLCPALPIFNNLKLQKTGPEDRCPVIGLNWECKFKLTITNGANPYTSEIAVLDALPFGTPAGSMIDFQPPAGWNCGSMLFFPNLYGCSSANPNLAAGASVEIPMIVKVPVGPGTSCTVNNNAQIIKAPPGSLHNVFAGDDAASASAEFQTVVNGDGTMFCVWPAIADPELPLAPPKPDPEDEPTVCPTGWTATPIPGKCCPYKTAWDGKQCGRKVSEPDPCPSGTVGTPPNCRELPTSCPKGYVGEPPNCRKVPTTCPTGYVGEPPNCRKLPTTCPKGYVGEPPNCRKLPTTCPKGFVGEPPNCRKLPTSCPSGYVGTPPNCEKLPKSCPKGYVGKPPNCRKLPTSCPKGYVGTPPNCRKLPKSCPKGYVGKPPNCRKLPKSCSKGYVGKPPNCRKLPKSCPKGYVGKPPNCRKVPKLCPKGYVGKPPNCKKLQLNEQIRKRARKRVIRLDR